MVLDYKKCSLTDLETLIEISRKTFVDAFEHQNNPEDFKNYIARAFNRETIKAQLNNPNSSFYFCYYKNELAAYFKMNEKEAQNEHFDMEAVELERIYVLQEVQGSGFGSDILKEVERLASQKNASYLWLGVWEVNIKAISFYERQGFLKFGKHPYLIGRDEQYDWLMKKELS